jgi:type IV secretory pathway VirB3-like protein
MMMVVLIVSKASNLCEDIVMNIWASKELDDNTDQLVRSVRIHEERKNKSIMNLMFLGAVDLKSENR